MRRSVVYLLVICSILLSGCSCRHEWIAASCDTPKTCANCGNIEGSALGHKWEDATCSKSMICSLCSQIVGEPLGHSWIDATCESPSICEICGQSKGEALGHSVDKWEILKDATCAETGVEKGMCAVCDKEAERSVALKEHNPSDWVVAVEPSQNSNGLKEKKCIECGTLLETEVFTLSAEEIESLYKEKCKKISYKDLERTPGKYEGEYVNFSGCVVQVCSEASSALYYSTYRVATSGRYGDVVYVKVDNYGSEERIIEDDYITFYGEYDGLYSYTTVRGDTLSIPSVEAEYID